MRGKVAKRLRQIARGLNLPAKTGYSSGGVLRRRPDRWESNEHGEQVRVPGPPIPRPGVLTECFRRGYKEAKKLYKGLPPTMCVPQADEKQETPYHVRIVDSLKKYYEATK